MPPVQSQVQYLIFILLLPFTFIMSQTNFTFRFCNSSLLRDMHRAFKEIVFISESTQFIM